MPPNKGVYGFRNDDQVERGGYRMKGGFENDGGRDVYPQIVMNCILTNILFCVFS